MKDFLWIAAAFALVAAWPGLQAVFAGDVEYDPAVGPVVLYSTQSCRYCRSTRDFLDRNEVPFVERDVELSPSAAREHRALGAFGVPVVLVGDTIIEGHRPRRLAAALEGA